MIRFFDFIFSLIGLIFLIPLLTLLFILGLFESRSPLFMQKRIGLDQKIFTLVKFRTMKLNTLDLGTHLVDSNSITNLGYYLRKFKLDELPQLWNVLVGNMSLVGPRPCLTNQKKLIIERKKRGVFNVKPGITGLAQISGISMNQPTLLAKTDLIMIKKIDLYFYFLIILKTINLVFKRKF